MPHAVKFSQFGGPDVLELVPMTRPVPADGEVVVEVMAAGLNPAETAVREGRYQSEYPLTFPVGQGSDFAGFISAIGSGVTGWAVNDAVFGHTILASHANFVVVPAGNILHKPDHLPWEVAGSLFVAASLAWNAVADANPAAGQTVLVHASAGGVGWIAAQLARLRGATVIGTASPSHFDHLRQIGVIPIAHGPDLTERLAALAPGGIDFELDHNASPSLVTIDSTDERALAQVAVMVANHQISVPVAAIYPLGQVQDAYRELEAGHAHGKIVLSMLPVGYAHQKVHAVDIRASEAMKDDPNRAPYPHTHEALPPVLGHRRGQPHPHYVEGDID